MGKYMLSHNIGCLGRESISGKRRYHVAIGVDMSDMKSEKVKRLVMRMSFSKKLIIKKLGKRMKRQATACVA